MERDFFEKKYELEQNGKKLELSETHFQPIFFAKGTNELRSDVKAQQALKQYRIFVKPEDMQVELKKEPLPQMDIAESLEQRIKMQQERDLKEYRLRKERESNPRLHRQENIAGHESKRSQNSQRGDDRSRRGGFVSGISSGGVRSSVSSFARKNQSNRRMMLYRLQSNSLSSGIQALVKPLTTKNQQQTSTSSKSPMTIIEGLGSPIGSSVTSGPSPTMFPFEKKSTIKKPAPLTEKQAEFVKRLSQVQPSKPRRVFRDRVAGASAG